MGNTRSHFKNLDQSPCAALLHFFRSVGVLEYWIVVLLPITPSFHYSIFPESTGVKRIFEMSCSIVHALPLNAVQMRVHGQPSTDGGQDDETVDA